jgi:hypothetical protein
MRDSAGQPVLCRNLHRSCKDQAEPWMLGGMTQLSHAQLMSSDHEPEIVLELLAEEEAKGRLD